MPWAREENDLPRNTLAYTRRCTWRGLQRALAERRVRIIPAAPGALIWFHPRGKDVVLTCTGRYRTGLSVEGARTSAIAAAIAAALAAMHGVASRSPILLLVPGKSESTPVDYGGCPGRTSIHTNLSVTVISLGGCSPWVRGKFVCLLPLIEWDATCRDEEEERENISG